jgi:hypothetical protein
MSSTVSADSSLYKEQWRKSPFDVSIASRLNNFLTTFMVPSRIAKDIAVSLRAEVAFGSAPFASIHSR